jgi:predicted TPR repeat methyltransferase
MLTGTLAEALAAYREAVGSEPEDPEKLARDSFHILSGYGHHEAAIRLGEAQRAQKPDDPIQTYLLAALKQAPIDRAPDDYVITYFDKFAETFDRQLVEVLDYHGPEKLYALVAMHDRPLDHDDFGLNQSKIMNVVDSNNLERDAGEKPVPTFSHPAQTRILDLGCGTGLAGPLLKRPGRVLTGVDLSPRMLEKAAARQAYDHLIASEAVAYLAQQEHGFDLIFAADFLIYVGDLAPLMRHAARLLGPGGLLALTIETTQDYDNFGLNQSKIVNVIDSKNLERDAGGKPLHTFPHPALETYRLLPSGRFAHRPGYIEDLTRGSFILRRQEPTMIRLEANRPVDGALLLFERI